MLWSACDNSDLQFIELTARGDPEALARLYDRYARVILSLFLRITLDRSVAEDLMQEFFLRVWGRSRAFDGTKGSVAAWMLSIARNMGIDHVRSAQARFSRRVQPIESLDSRSQRDYSADCESALHNRRLISKALAALTYNHRRVVELAYYEGRSQTEIAALLDVPLGTIKSWMRSGLDALRSSLAFASMAIGAGVQSGKATQTPLPMAS